MPQLLLNNLYIFYRRFFPCRAHHFFDFSDAKISKKVSQSAALSVIKTHKNFVGNHQTGDSSNAQKNANASMSNAAVTTTISSASSACGTAAATITTTVDNTIGKSQEKYEQSEKRQMNSDACNQLSNAEQSTQSAVTISANTANVAESTDIRPKYRYANAFPGRPQLQKFSPQLSRDVEYESKIEKFKALLDDPQLNLRDLREVSWSGIPKKMRAVTWRLLSGYLPTALERRNSILEHKRLNYSNLVEQYFRVESRDEAQQETFRQIHIDMPRMNPHIRLFQQTLVQEMFERILFIWAIRHPASGYVQGINDLVTPFFIVFLQEALESVDLS